MFPLRKFYTKQMFVLLRIELRNHVDTKSEALQTLQGYALYIRY